MKILPTSFYDRDPLTVAPDILGKILVRKYKNKTISGRIVEVEAYLGFTDEASHSFIGKTKRNSSLFKNAGHAYVHRIHTQNCLDIVTENENLPTSILIRALEPLEGTLAMKKFRNKENLKDLTSGPGKITQALKIDKEFDGIDMTNTKSPLYVVDDGFLINNFTQGKRIGISKAQDNEYRFYIKDNLYVSRK